jgi:hypothetical protein
VPSRTAEVVRLQHPIERVVGEQVAFLEIGGQGRVAGVAPELLDLRGMNAPVLGCVHRAALERVTTQDRRVEPCRRAARSLTVLTARGFAGGGW